MSCERSSTSSEYSAFSFQDSKINCQGLPEQNGRFQRSLKKQQKYKLIYLSVVWKATMPQFSDIEFHFIVRANISTRELGGGEIRSLGVERK